MSLSLAAALAAFAAQSLELTKAIHVQEALVAQRPTDATAQNDLGNLLVLDGRLAEAEAAYRRAVELDGAILSAHFNLALLLEQRGESREALKHFRRVVELDPTHAWAHYQIGMIHQERGSKGAAIRAYARAFALDSQLALAEVNPHVLDNEWATEALLRSSRERRTDPPAPRSYEEPARIARLLVGADAEGEEGDEELVEEGIRSGGPVRFDEGAGGGEGIGANGKTLGEEDLGEAGSGQVTGGGAVVLAPVRGGVRSPGSGSSSRTLQPPSAAPPPSRYNPGDSFLPGRYRPGVSSTGRLELELIPAADSSSPAG